MSTEIVETVRAVAAAEIFKFTGRRVRQRRLDTLGLVVLSTSLGCRGSLLCIVTVEIFQGADLIIYNTLVMILVVILVQLMRVAGMVRGDTSGEACGRCPVVVLVVIAVLVVAFV